MNKTSAKGKSGRGPRQNKAQPPSISTNIVYRHVFRFLSTTGTAKTISGVDLIGCTGVVNTAANTVTQISNSIKLHSVKVWTPPASQGASATCSLEWNSSLFNPTTEVSDSTMSTAIPAHIATSPPSGSEAAFWMSGATENVFTLVAPTGSIIDIDLSVVLVDTGAAGVVETTAAAGTLGEMYYLGLPNASPAYTPVSLNTIA